MNIWGKRILIRAIEATDMPLLQEMINDYEIETSVGGWSFPTSSAEQLRWYENILSDRQTKRFMIETTDRKDNLTIGMIYLSEIDWKNRSASTGIKLSRTAPRKNGYATDAVKALLEFAFYELQMHRISLKILKTNEASVRLYEKCGAKREGIIRQSVFKQGQYIDQYCYGILKDDFEEIKCDE